MSDRTDDQERLAVAVRGFWVALSDIDPLDRLGMSTIGTVGLAVGIHEGLGLFAPFYAVLLMGVGAAMFWALRLLARSKAP